jgi:hypothetical protein
MFSCLTSLPSFSVAVAGIRKPGILATVPRKAVRPFRFRCQRARFPGSDTTDSVSTLAFCRDGADST